MNYRNYVKQYYPKSVLLIAATACVQGLFPALVIQVRARVIDLALPGESSRGSMFLSALLLFAALSLGEVIARKLGQRITEKQAIITGAALDRQRVEKAGRIKYVLTETKDFHRLHQEAKKAPELDGRCFQAVGNILWLSVNLAASAAVILYLVPSVMIGILLLLAAGLGFTIVHSKKTAGFWRRYQDKMRRCNYLSDLLLQREYAAERKLFGFQPEISRRFSVEFEKARGENIKQGRVRAATEILQQAVFAVYSAVVILLLLRPLLAGRITIGTFYSVFYGAEGLILRGSRLYEAVFDFSSCFRQMNGYFEFMALKEEIAEENQAAGNDLRDGRQEQLCRIEFKNVTFTYPGAERPVLDGLSFQLTSGKHYALVGENGCGKSTLVKLLVGLYEPDTGEILINGRPVSDWSREELRSVFSVVFQDFYRYPLTVRENITLSVGGEPGEAKLDQALRAVRLDETVEKLPRGIDTNLMLLSQDGVSLSGGEWQKMTIARCVLSGARMAILDEPNASLDPISEASIYRAYREALEETTTLFISHRLGSVRMSDEILVLKGGRLLAMDSHERLMESCSYYAELFNTQKDMYLRG